MTIFLRKPLKNIIFTHLIAMIIKTKETYEMERTSFYNRKGNNNE